MGEELLPGPAGRRWAGRRGGGRRRGEERYFEGAGGVRDEIRCEVFPHSARRRVKDSSSW